MEAAEKWLTCGSLAQLGEHLPYKQRVIGSIPITSTRNGPVVQLVRTLACHARGRGFESLPGRHFFASIAQSVEQRTENPRVGGSIPPQGTISFFGSICGSGSVVEHRLAKARVASSNLVFRSNFADVVQW